MLTRERMARIGGVVTDLDGTLLRSDGTLSPVTIRFLGRMRELGIPLVVATARTPRAVAKIVGHEHLGRVVCANGAVVWDAGRGEVVHQSCFDRAALSAGLARLRTELPEAGFALLSVDAMFLDEASVALRGKRSGGAEVSSDIDAVLAAHPIAMVAVRHPRLAAEEMLAAASAAFAYAGEASFAGLGVVDIAPRGTTKAVAGAREMAHLGCAPEETIVFGDMPNDLPLFAWSGWACAVANAHPSVLEAADEVVPGNDEDGVARTVERLLSPSRRRR